MATNEDKNYLESVKGLALGDKQSYLSSALEELDNAQIPADQLNFPVPSNLEEHISKQRAEAAEALKGLQDNKPEEGMIDGASSGTNEGLQGSGNISNIKKTKSWSQFDSPDHHPNFVDQSKNTDPEIRTDSDKKSPMRSGVKDEFAKRRATIMRYGRSPPLGIINEQGYSNSAQMSQEALTESKESKNVPKLRISEKQRQNILERLRLKKTSEEIHNESNFSETNDEESEELSEEEGGDDEQGDQEDNYIIAGPDELIEAINGEFSRLNMYPSDDHTDHIFFLHQKNKLTKRDLHYYCLGVSKERSISFAKKTLDMMTKLEGLLSLANKNMTTTTTNLKISENNITALHSFKKSISTLKSDVVVPNTRENLTKELVSNKKSEITERETAKTDSALKDKGKGVLIETGKPGKREIPNTIVSNKPIRIKEPSERENDDTKKVPTVASSQIHKSEVNSSTELNKINPVGSKTTEEEDNAKKIAAFYEIDLSDSLLSNPSVMEKLLPMMTDSLMEKIYKGDAKYKSTVQKVLLSNLKKQLQK